MIRRVLRKLSRGRVLRRRLSPRFGARSIYVTPESALAYWKWDVVSAFPEIFRWAEATVRPKDVVWDVGANVGLFSFAASALTGAQGQVVAFEPDTFLVELMRKAKSAANCARIDVLPVAVGREFSVTRLNIAEGGRSGNYVSSSIGSSMALSVRSTIPVLATTLDSLLDSLPMPNVLKIDVEGAELDVLQGAARLLRENQPVILCEVNSANASDVSRLLTGFGYRMFDLEVTPFPTVETAVSNTLCLPQTRIAEFQHQHYVTCEMRRAG